MCDHAAGFPISEELGASLAESAGLREQVMAQIGLDRGERGWGGGRSTPFFDDDDEVKLTSADASFTKFKLSVTNPDGLTSVEGRHAGQRGGATCGTGPLR